MKCPECGNELKKELFSVFWLFLNNIPNINAPSIGTTAYPAFALPSFKNTYPAPANVSIINTICKIKNILHFTYSKEFNNCYILLSNNSQALENTKFVAGELSLRLSLVLYLPIWVYKL